MKKISFIFSNKAISTIFVLGSIFLLFTGIFWSVTCNSFSLLLFSVIVLLCFVFLYGTMVFGSTSSIVDSNSINNTSKPIDRKYLICFSIVLILSGLFFCLIITPGKVPDEPRHFIWTYQFANFLSGQDVYCAGKTYARACDEAFFGSTINSTAINFEQYQSVINTLCSSFDVSSSFMDASSFSLTSSVTLPQERFIPALGIVFSRLLKLNPVFLFYSGRLLNFSIFCIAVIYAVKIIPHGKRFLMVLALLPMTLQETCSYSYDSTIITLSFLLFAMFVRAFTSDKPLSNKEFFELLVLSILLAPCKVIYSVLAFLFILIPTKRFSGRRQRVIFNFAYFGILLLAIILISSPSILGLTSTDPVTSQSLDTRGEETGIFYNLSDFIADPLRFAFIFMNTLNSRFDFYVQGIIGGSLGWFQANLIAPWWLVILYVALLFSSLTKIEGSNFSPSFFQRLFAFSLFAAGFGAIMLALALGWTFNTEDTIQGVQGRYILPLIPLLYISFHTNFLVIPKSYASQRHLVTISCASLLNFYYVIYFFGCAIG